MFKDIQSLPSHGIKKPLTKETILCHFTRWVSQIKGSHCLRATLPGPHLSISCGLAVSGSLSGTSHIGREGYSLVSGAGRRISKAAPGLHPSFLAPRTGDFKAENSQMSLVESRLKPDHSSEPPCHSTNLLLCLNTLLRGSSSFHSTLNGFMTII